MEFVDQRDRDLLLARKQEVSLAFAGKLVITADTRWAVASRAPPVRRCIAPGVSVQTHQLTGSSDVSLGRLSQARGSGSQFEAKSITATRAAPILPVSPVGCLSYAQVVAGTAAPSTSVSRAVQSVAVPFYKGAKKGLVPRTTLTRD